MALLRMGTDSNFAGMKKLLQKVGPMVVKFLQKMVPRVGKLRQKVVPSSCGKWVPGWEISCRRWVSGWGTQGGEGGFQGRDALAGSGSKNGQAPQKVGPRVTELLQKVGLICSSEAAYTVC